MRKCALVGGAGFIGAHLARRLADAGEDVVILDAGEDYGRAGSAESDAVLAWRRTVLLQGLEVVDADTRDGVSVSRAIAAFAPTHVVHLGNVPLADVVARDPAGARRSIVTGTWKLLGACAALPSPPRFVYVSSSMVYGHFVRDPQDEDAPTEPVNAYGRLKLVAERAVATSGLRWTIVRPASVYGPGDVNGRLIERMVDAAATGRAFTLTCSPATRLDFTWVGDIAAGIHAALCEPRATARAYNLSGGRSRSVAEALAVVAAHAPELRVVERPPTTDRPRRGTLDISRATRDLGWAPAMTLEEGLPAYLTVAREIVAAAV